MQFKHNTKDWRAWVIFVIGFLFLFSFSFSNIIYFSRFKNSIPPNISYKEIEIMLTVNIIFIVIIAMLTFYSIYKMYSYHREHIIEPCNSNITE